MCAQQPPVPNSLSRAAAAAAASVRYRLSSTIYLVRTKKKSIRPRPNGPSSIILFLFARPVSCCWPDGVSLCRAGCPAFPSRKKKKAAQYEDSLLAPSPLTSSTEQQEKKRICKKEKKIIPCVYNALQRPNDMESN